VKLSQILFGEDKEMKRICLNALLFSLAAMTLLVCDTLCNAAQNKDKGNWPTELPKRKHDPSELSERDINRIMDRVKQVNPDRARKLANLRKENPKKFEAELKEMVRAGFREKTRPQEELGAEEKFRPRGWDKDPKARELINMRYDRHLEWLTVMLSAGRSPTMPSLITLGTDKAARQQVLISAGRSTAGTCRWSATSCHTTSPSTMLQAGSR